jgi:hypothetical protein
MNFGVSLLFAYLSGLVTMFLLFHSRDAWVFTLALSMVLSWFLVTYRVFCDEWSAVQSRTEDLEKLVELPSWLTEGHE